VLRNGVTVTPAMAQRRGAASEMDVLKRLDAGGESILADAGAPASLNIRTTAGSFLERGGQAGSESASSRSPGIRLRVVCARGQFSSEAGRRNFTELLSRNRHAHGMS